MLVSVWQSLLPTWHRSRLLSACWKYLDTKSGEPEPGMYFSWWGGRTNPRGHFMFFFMYHLKASSMPPPPPHPRPVQSLPVNTQTKQNALLSSLKKRKTTATLPEQSQYFWILNSANICFPSVVKMQMPSSFLPPFLSLDYFEICYLFLGKVKELFLVGSLQKPQGTKHLLFLDPTVPLLLDSVLETLCPGKMRILICRLKNIYCTAGLTTYFQSAVFKTC